MGVFARRPAVGERFLSFRVLERTRRNSPTAIHKFNTLESRESDRHFRDSSTFIIQIPGAPSGFWRSPMPRKYFQGNGLCLMKYPFWR
jgi:hypothetical protein